MPKQPSAALAPAAKPEQRREIAVNPQAALAPPGSPLQPIGGSPDPAFNAALIQRTANVVFVPGHLTPAQRQDEGNSVVAALRGFAPRDEIEGMLAAQAVALHHTAMECLRRSFLPDQTFDAADRLRKQAATLSQKVVEMAEAIDRRRGKGPQVVRVERVVVHEGGQAIVGAVSQGAGGGPDVR